MGTMGCLKCGSEKLRLVEKPSYFSNSYYACGHCGLWVTVKDYNMIVSQIVLEQVLEES